MAIAAAAPAAIPAAGRTKAPAATPPPTIPPIQASVALVAAAATSGSAILIVLSLVLAIGAVLLSILVHGALSGIYAAALYRFATQNGDSQGFDTDALRSAFVVKGA